MSYCEGTRVWLGDETNRFGRENEDSQRAPDSLEQGQLLDADRLAVDVIPEWLRNGLESLAAGSCQMWSRCNDLWPGRLEPSYGRLRAGAMPSNCSS